MRQEIKHSSDNWQPGLTEGSSLPNVDTDKDKVAAAIDAGTRCPPKTGIVFRTVTRTFDIIVATTLILLTLPLFVVLAIIIHTDSPGPAIFTHIRIGKNRRTSDSDPPAEGDRRVENHFGRPFTLYKFRTMYQDARDRFPERYAYKYTDEQLYTLPMKALLGSESGNVKNNCDDKLGDDPRLTRVGRWLRRTSLDELPNLLNVMKGDLSLVGPRPDISDNIRHYLPRHMVKLCVRPGVTGLAQVMGRGTLPFHATNEYDVEYVENLSLRRYFLILIKTFSVLITREGAY